jgi:hypothetical protein
MGVCLALTCLAVLALAAAPVESAICAPVNPNGKNNLTRTDVSGLGAIGAHLLVNPAGSFKCKTAAYQRRLLYSS